MPEPTPTPAPDLASLDARLASLEDKVTKLASPVSPAPPPAPNPSTVTTAWDGIKTALLWVLIGAALAIKLEPFPTPPPAPVPIPTPVPPGPGPIPTPIPIPPPVPPAPPAPIPHPGLRVLMTYDLKALTADQSTLMGDKSLREWLSSVCTKGPDGVTPEWRVYPSGMDMSSESDIWKGVMARPRPSLPWVVISNGRTGTEEPMPPTPAEFKALVSKYVEAK